MKELTKHIEALLVENDCVILPQFGGFVTNHTPARWVEEENIFLPPYRTIGFNSQLKINDGLLVQSYMMTHDATYPEATRLAEAAIERLSEELYKEGEVELNGIGTLRRSIVGEYLFEPTQDGVITPTLYGLCSVEMKTLAMLEEERKQQSTPRIEVETMAVETSTIESEERTITIKIRREWIANAISVAAAIILFFLLSTPVNNTYIEEENYASLGNINVFEQVKNASLLTTLMATYVEPNTADIANTKKTASKMKATPASLMELAKEAPLPVAKNSQASVPKANPVSETKSVSATKRATALVGKAIPVAATKTNVDSTPKKKSASYNIIIASVPAESDAKHTIDEFAAKGHPGAFLIKGGGRFRIAIKAFDSEAEAYKIVNELKKEPLFKDAWVLKTK